MPYETICNLSSVFKGLNIEIQFCRDLCGHSTCSIIMGIVMFSGMAVKYLRDDSTVDSIVL